jgi:hypothetical protein
MPNIRNASYRFTADRLLLVVPDIEFSAHQDRVAFGAEVFALSKIDVGGVVWRQSRVGGFPFRACLRKWFSMREANSLSSLFFLNENQASKAATVLSERL